MDDKVRCQSCGMPVSDQFGNFGTMTDGSKNPEYCSFCFQNGAFTNPDQTVAEMVQSSIGFMTANLGFTAEKAAEMSNSVIPNLRRWRQ
jgi:hypothetical protein